MTDRETILAMTDPQPYTGEELEQCVAFIETRIGRANQGWVTTTFIEYEAKGLVATLRDYQRVLAENATLREDKEMHARFVQERRRDD